MSFNKGAQATGITTASLWNWWNNIYISSNLLKCRDGQITCCIIDVACWKLSQLCYLSFWKFWLMCSQFSDKISFYFRIDNMYWKQARTQSIHSITPFCSWSEWVSCRTSIYLLMYISFSRSEEGVVGVCLTLWSVYNANWVQLGSI